MLKALEKEAEGRGGPRLGKRDRKLINVLKHELQTPNPKKRKRSQRNKRAGKHNYWARKKHLFFGNANDTTLAPPAYEAEAEEAATESDASDSSGAHAGKSDFGGLEHSCVRGHQPPVASSDCARAAAAARPRDWNSQIAHGYLMSTG